MNNITVYINEKLRINKDSKNQYKYCPKNYKELRKIIERILSKKGVNADLNDIDTSNITTMANLFMGLYPCNIDISQWNVSNVTDMNYMFFKCKHFNCDLSSWDVSNVTNMKGMFSNCENFKGDGLEKWDVSNVENMNYMFYRARKLNCNLNNWHVDNVKSVISIFDECDSLDIPSWYKK